MNYLVSGGSKGLGEAICKKILLENENNTVITFSRNITDSVKELQKKYKRRYFFYEFDLSCLNKIHGFVNELINLHGDINSLVNNAAVGSDGLLATMHESEIISSININSCISFYSKFNLEIILVK